MNHKTSSLTPEILHIVRDRGTEYPHSGEYNDYDLPGTYLCRQCGLALFRAETKFASQCGWPSFDAQIADAVSQRDDPDGRRTEIICRRCQAHLGHIFHGENLTPRNWRYCVNSLSLDFVADRNVTDTAEAIFAAGCFWGVEYYFKKLPGVLKTEVGYTGGQKAHPSYQEVCAKNTGHFEALRVIYDPAKLTYAELVKYFFEIHDPSQVNGQGPDLGPQYLSAIFYYDLAQQETANTIASSLKNQGLPVATQILPASTFWPAEAYHQDYYAKTDQAPYCHRYIKRF